MFQQTRKCLPIFGAFLFVQFVSCANNEGRFFHLSDVHYDPLYGAAPYPAVSSCAGDIDADQYPYGNYICDSPWALVESAFSAMAGVVGDPDFIVWTGDSPGGLPQDHLPNTTVLSIIHNVSSLLLDNFVDTPVYPAIGNHDNWPRHELVPEPNSFRDGLAQVWSPWLEDYVGAMDTFKQGGYYVTPIQGTNLLMLVLNTAFYYFKDPLTENVPDPAGQFAWMEDILAGANNDNKKVFIIAHIPPGSLEREVKISFQSSFNEKYLEIIRRYGHVIKGQFYGHHHYDSFRVMYDSQGAPTNALYIHSSLTPRSTPDARNPSFRLVTYDRDTGDVIDLDQYYLDIANQDGGPMTATWSREYRATEAYGIPDIGPNSLDQLVGEFSDEGPSGGEYFTRYYQHNNAMADAGECDEQCKQLHLCAITKVDIPDFEDCMAAGQGNRLVGGPIKELAVATLVMLFHRLF